MVDGTAAYASGSLRRRRAAGAPGGEGAVGVRRPAVRERERRPGAVAVQLDLPVGSTRFVRLF